MALCEPVGLKDEKMLALGAAGARWLPGWASVALGPACAALGSAAPPSPWWGATGDWQASHMYTALLACVPLLLPMLCAFAVGVLLRAQMGSARYLTPPGLGLRRAWLACSAAYAVSRVPQPPLPLTRVLPSARVVPSFAAPPLLVGFVAKILWEFATQDYLLQWGQINDILDL